MSQMEKTLRLPYLIDFAVKLFFTRAISTWFIFGFIFWLLLHNVFASVVLGLVVFLVWEMFFLSVWYEKTVLPQHIIRMDDIKQFFRKLNSYSTPNLIDQVEETVKKSAWSIIYIGYMALPSWGWEIVFKILYPFLVSNKSIPYQNLLIGFHNKTIEADQKLWEVSQEKDFSTQKKQLEHYLEEYGSRVDDLDIALPTLRERPKAIESLLALSKLSPSPKSRLESAEIKRGQSMKQVEKQLRLPASVFNWFVQIVQKNVALREDRRYYEFQADYYLRQMLLHLAKRINIPEDKLFEMSWKEVKNAAQR